MKTKQTIFIIIGTILLILAIAGSLEHSYFYYKNEQPNCSFTQYYLGGHWNDTDAAKDPSSDLYRGF
ncbi:MAG: hypothetical protein IJ429_02130 [Lachnospiraceae bacterium]|nr:hypothetical protein [Lachnospiraceae bacterium]